MFCSVLLPDRTLNVVIELKYTQRSKTLLTIFLLPIVSKVLERCVYFKFYDHIQYSVSQTQHGFLRKRSCVTQLLSTPNTMGNDRDKNTQTDVLYLDFAKTFDSVDHTIVLEKLRGYGVARPILGWFKDYLSGRTQRVVLDGAVSTWSQVTCGVPQGSILGPLLFVIFINDLPDVVQNGTETALYADDTKLHQTMHQTITTINDCKSLQQSLTNLNSWSIQNNIHFNATKCKVLTLTRKKTPVNIDYNLTRVDNKKDLSVITSSTFSWELHINSVISKANKILGVLKRTCCQLTDMKTRRTLYLSLVKSQLSFAPEVWFAANNDQLSKRVERVQRRATRWIMMSIRGELSYKERLSALNLLPLSFDRKIKDLVFLYKALFGYVNVNVSNYVSFVSHGRLRLSNSSKYILQIQICRTNTFQSPYYNRVVKVWNIVCKDVCLNTVSSPNTFTCLVNVDTLVLLILFMMLTCHVRGVLVS